MNNQKILMANSAIWAAFDGLTSAYLVAFALMLGASNTIIGVLGALPWLASIVTQIPGSELVGHYCRKKIYFIFTLIGRMFWLAILTVPFAFKNPIPFIIAFYLLAKIGESITEPAYSSMLADIVPTRHLGEFNSKRFRVISMFGVAALVSGGLWLKQFPKQSPIGFAIMFGFGALLAITAAILMLKLKEPEYTDHEHHTIREFLTLNGQMKKYALFGAAFSFAYMLSSPFFAVYMLKTLKMSYLFYGIAAAVSTLAQVVASRYIGKLTDKYGDKPMALIGHIGTAAVPLLFLAISTKNIWLIIPVQIYSGIVWTAADLTRFNLLLGVSDKTRRAMQIAEYNLYVSIPMIIAPIAGGWITENAAIMLTGIPLVFLISSILRLASSFLLFSIKEPRGKEEYPMTYVFREAMHFHPNKGIQYGIQIIRRIAGGLVK